VIFGVRAEVDRPKIANPRDLGGRPGRPNHPIANLVFALLEDAFPVTRRHSHVMSNSGAPKQSRLSTEVLNFDAPQLACRTVPVRPHIVYDAICHTTHPLPRWFQRVRDMVLVE